MRKTWQHWSEIRHHEAWSRRVASRALVRHMVEDKETPTEPVSFSTLLPGRDALTEFEERAGIARLLSGLPYRQRQVLAWTLLGFTPAEIADELDLTPEAVRASLMKARRRIAALRGREERDDDQ